MRPLLAPLILAAATLVAGCDLLGIEPASAVAARKEAEGKAVGAACRHAARSIEACYEANRKADKAAIFAGWREMNDYMRENQIEAMPAAPKSAAADEAGDARVAEAPSGKDGDGGTGAGTGAKGEGKPARR